ncbi:MFS transporter [Nonomuraea sp. WAC 01424]|uniref:MFS transporter n=1 Tax=Nonomuraea sp. WAC 01424 TaxID=2203200 RepID=UPI000F7B7124|nr:MFS transporter [Nonomuraea sp. WAC 01424]RSN15719.1 MFS transporter [Nonomuraea sp. WAC 01424]
MTRLGRAFGFLWSSTALSNLADGVLRVGAPLLAVSMTRSPTLVSLAGPAAPAPWLLFALHAGAVADRADRRRVMALANAVRTAVLATGTLLAAMGLLNLWVLLAVVFAAGVSEVFADLSAQSVLPMTVSREDLTRANGRIVSAQTIGNDFVGGPVAGLLAALLPAALFGAPALLYGAAALLLTGMRGSYRAAPAGPRRRLRADIGEALRYLWSHRFLRSLALSAGLLNVSSAAYFAVFVLWAVGDGSRMGLEPGGYGLMMTALAAGAVLGSPLTGPATRLLGEQAVLVGAWLTSSLLLLVPVLVPSPWALYPVAVVWGVTGAAANVLVVSVRQRVIPGELLGRVNSAYRLVGMGGMPLGAALGGVAGEFFGLAAVLAGAAGLGLVAVGLVWRAMPGRISAALTSTPTLSDISRSP